MGDRIRVLLRMGQTPPLSDTGTDQDHSFDGSLPIFTEQERWIQAMANGRDPRTMDDPMDDPAQATTITGEPRAPPPEPPPRI